MWLLQNMLDHMLTIHVRSRVFPTMDDAAQFVKAIVTLYDVYVESKSQHVLQVAPTTASIACHLQACWLHAAQGFTSCCSALNSALSARASFRQQ